MTFGSIIYRFRWVVLLIWLGGTAALLLLAGDDDPSANEQTSFLPDDTDYARAVHAMEESFPGQTGLSSAVVIFERADGPLTDGDRHAIASIAKAIPVSAANATPATSPAASAGNAKTFSGVTFRAPDDLQILQTLGADNPLISPVGSNGQAGIIIVSVPATFITIRSGLIVQALRDIAAGAKLPAGLTVAVTGNSGFGYDYAQAAQTSHHRTIMVTIVAVIIILMLVYRAPLAALMPLLAISVAGMVASRMLILSQHFGLHVGTAEMIFVFVLLYGAGTDYSLLFISRYRELLDRTLGSPADKSARSAAVAGALDSTAPAIVSSAGTNIAGLMMLMFADYVIFRNTGPAVAIAMGVALFASVTLVPALVALTGRVIFWPPSWRGLSRSSASSAEKGTVPAPHSPDARHLGKRRFWTRIATIVTTRPGTVLIVMLIVMAGPAIQGIRQQFRYDTLTAVPVDFSGGVGNSAAGMEMAGRHWPVGQIAPITVMVRQKAPAKDWDTEIADMTGALKAIPGVRDVRSLTEPLGTSARKLNMVVKTAIRSQAKPDYLNPQQTASRLIVTLDTPPLGPAAMDAFSRLRETAKTAAARYGGETYLAGATAEMVDTRHVTQSDFHRVAVLTLGAIFVILVLLLADPILSAFMVFSTVASYLVTLGVSYWVFTGLLGAGGLDWKVEVFLFVVLVAVGQDYNIFLATRLAQEARHSEARKATRIAVLATGPVISSCGLIMAATLGSVVVGDLVLMRQLGFAFALGMLIDTFLVRPLLLPSFVALTRRTGRLGLLRLHREENEK